LGLPFALTFASLVSIIIVETGLLTNKSYYFAKFDTQNLSISSSDVLNSLSKRSVLLTRDNGTGIAHLTTEALANIDTTTTGSSAPSSTGIAHLTTEALGNSASDSVTAQSSINVTAADLGLANSYTVGLWSYCGQKESDGKTNQTCSKAKADFWFDPFSIWGLNETAVEQTINSSSLTDALNTYEKASKAAWVFYLVALISTIVELAFGVVAIFSRIGSCLTTIVSSISTVSIIMASIIATVMWSLVVASFNTELGKYGVSASLNVSMLAATWLAVAFSMASGFFWFISICCCGSTDRTFHRSPKRARDMNPEKLAYEPVQDPAFVSSPYAQQPAAYNTPQARPTRDFNTAYEPYRHDQI